MSPMPRVAPTHNSPSIYFPKGSRENTTLEPWEGQAEHLRVCHGNKQPQSEMADAPGFLSPGPGGRKEKGEQPPP